MFCKEFSIICRSKIRVCVLLWIPFFLEKDFFFFLWTPSHLFYWKGKEMTAAVPLDFEGDKSLKTYETALSTSGQIYGNVQVKHSTVTEIWKPLFWKVFSWNTLIYGLVPFPGRKRVVLNRLCSKILSEIVCVSSSQNRRRQKDPSTSDFQVGVQHLKESLQGSNEYIWHRLFFCIATPEKLWR